ncbi:hypothetical protein [Parasitella parasitica]|uniref:Uncharacterized protein n=1 Tax=Parasitella parasitica TaxID=35722 RepID=A0A0B7NBL2_9FUNG|nr:hypothetical protein [Parasitella parasitica]
MSSNSTQINKNNKQFDIFAKEFQNQFASASSGSTPTNISDETHVSSTSILPKITADTSDMSESTSDVLPNNDIHASNTLGYQAGSTVGFSSNNVAIKSNYFKTVNDFPTLNNKKFTDIGYFATSDERRDILSDIEWLKFAVSNTEITVLAVIMSLLTLTIWGLLQELETAQQTREELEKLWYQPWQPSDVFLDNFQSLRKQSQINDREVRWTDLHNYLVASRPISASKKQRILNNRRGSKYKLRCVYQPDSTNHREEHSNASTDKKQRINASESEIGGGKSKSRDCFNSKKPD